MNTAQSFTRSDGGAQTLPDLLAALERQHIRLSASEGRIHYAGPRGAMTLEVKQAIATHKAALLALLAPPADMPGLDASASPRAGLGELSGLACNRGARHYPYWQYAPDLAPCPRWVCRLCEPELYACVHAQEALQARQPIEERQEAIPAHKTHQEAQERLQARQEAASALLAWGAAHGYPRQPYAWAQGASTGTAAPYLSIAAGADCWQRFSVAARGADLLAACHAVGVTLAPARADLLASMLPGNAPADAPGAPGGPGNAGNAGNAQEHQGAPIEEGQQTPRRNAHRRGVQTPDTLAVLDAAGLWIARPGASGAPGAGPAGASGAAPAGEEITHITDGIPAPSPNVDAGALLTFAREQGISQLWVHASWALAAGLPERIKDTRRGRDSEASEEEEAHPFIAGAIGAGWDMRPAGLAPWIHAFQPGTYGAIALVLPHLDKQAPQWCKARDGRELLAALLAYRAALAGHGYRRSPGVTGVSLLRAVHRGNKVALDLSASASPADFPAPARAGRNAPDLKWIRPLTGEERERCAYVHAYDKNAMYLGASASLPLGLGLPEHVTAGEERQEEGAGLTFDKRLAGYWLARIEYTPPAGLPNPFIAPLHQTDASGAGWYLSPMLELAYQIGAQVTLQEAYIWRSSHRIMAPWYERLRDARADLLARSVDSTGATDNVAAGLALDVLKATYGHAVGKLNEGRLRASDTPEDLYRPDWRDSVMAQAAANLYRELLKVQRESGRVPFALDTDCAYFASDVFDTRAACPAPLQLGTGLRHVKPNKDADGAPLAPVAALLDQADPDEYASPRHLVNDVKQTLKEAREQIGTGDIDGTDAQGATDATPGQEEA